MKKVLGFRLRSYSKSNWLLLVSSRTLLKTSRKFIHKFLSNPADRETNRSKITTFLLDVMIKQKPLKQHMQQCAFLILMTCVKQIKHRNMRTCHQRNGTRWCGLASAQPPQGGPSPCQRYSRHVNHHQAWLTAGWSHARSAVTDVHMTLPHTNVASIKINPCTVRTCHIVI